MPIGRVALVCLLLLAGCRRAQETVLGKAPTDDPRTILSVRTGAPGAQVTIRGEMVEKCPVAGCWFRVHDSTGTIKVDTKSAGFVVVNVPLASTVTVAGILVTVGDEVMVEAAGLRY